MSTAKPSPKKHKPSPKNEPQQPQEPDFGQQILNFLLRFQRYAGDLLIILLFALGLVVLLGLLGVTSGVVITPVVSFFRRWLGIGSYMVALLSFWLGYMLFQNRLSGQTEFGKPGPSVHWGRLVSLEIAVFCLMALVSLSNGSRIDRAEQGQDGGIIGWGIADLVQLGLGSWLGSLVLGLVLLVALMVGLGVWGKFWTWAAKKLEGQPVGIPAAHQGLETGLPVQDSPVSQRHKPVHLSPANQANGGRAHPVLDNQFKKNFKVDSTPAKPAGPPPPRSQDLPPLSLLSDEKTNRPDERHINLTAGLIEKTLSDFGIPAKVIDVQIGPTVTQFAVQPGFIEKPGLTEEEIRRQKVRVAQISGLARDLTLALSAQRLRIEAPVPGKNYIGIEVPNQSATLVRLRPLLESENYYKMGSPLTIALGQDVSGRPVVADLAKMPHILIAGTTGSGKSVGITAIATCLIMNNSPETLRLVLIDPKKVELVRFNGLPHILGKVETDLERILGVLRWVVAEMDQRYKLLEQYRARNIDAYNKKIQGKRNASPLPYIVVMVDELADLMMLAAEQAEPALVRLAQLARATGIHLVIATQRPSTDVITGLIKANFPARLAFNVAAAVDSRVILDTQGAESLLGKGDMLFQPPDAPAPLRAQGAIISDQELSRIIHFWQEQYAQDEGDAPWDMMLAQEEVAADRDDLVTQAIEIIKKSRRVSASMLQRRLRIGYPRAARLVDELEEMGVIGPARGAGLQRDVLLDPDENPDGDVEDENF